MDNRYNRHNRRKYSLIYKAPPTEQGQWVSAYNNRKVFIYEEELLLKEKLASAELPEESREQNVPETDVWHIDEMQDSDEEIPENEEFTAADVCIDEEVAAEEPEGEPALDERDGKTKKRENVSVRIYFEYDRTKVPEVGDIITARAELTGIAEEDVARYQWQVETENGFAEIEGANEAVYTFVLTEETARNRYRLEVTAY